MSSCSSLLAGLAILTLAVPAHAQMLDPPEAFAPGFPHPMQVWVKPALPLAKAMKCPNRTVTFKYDDAGRLVRMETKFLSIEDGVNDTTLEWAYLPDGKMSKALYHGSNTSSEETAKYAASGLLESSSERLGEPEGEGIEWTNLALSKYTYDNAGPLTKIVDCDYDGNSCGLWQEYTWTKEGKVESILLYDKDKVTERRSYTYGPKGEMTGIVVRDAEGKTVEKETKYTYDDAGRLVEQSEGGNVGALVIRHTYDSAGKVVSILAHEEGQAEEKCEMQY